MEHASPRSTDQLQVPAELAGQTVLITGGAGFVGGHLAAALVSECEVRVLDDLSSGSPDRVPNSATFVEGDIRDSETVDELVDGVNVVFHQAGLVSVPASVERPVESHERNVAGTLNVLEAAREEGARVVSASSVAVYGNPTSTPIQETDTKEPTSPYGLDKLALDHYSRLYHEQYDVETVALRYFNVYGPHQATGGYGGVISTFLEQARNNESLTVEGDGTQTRDFIHVSDVVRANLAAATTDHIGRAYNIGTGTSISIIELADLVRTLAETEPEIIHTAPRPNDILHSCSDTERAREELGFEPTVELESGLADLLAAGVPTQ